MALQHKTPTGRLMALQHKKSTSDNEQCTNQLGCVMPGHH